MVATSSSVTRGLNSAWHSASGSASAFPLLLASSPPPFAGASLGDSPPFPATPAFSVKPPNPVPVKVAADPNTGAAGASTGFGSSAAFSPSADIGPRSSSEGDTRTQTHHRRGDQRA